MGKLLALIVDKETATQEMVNYVQALQRQQLIIIADAATVVRQADGKVKLSQVNSLVGAGAWGRAFWDLLIGWLLQAPESRQAAGNHVANCGLDDDFIRQVGGAVKPKSSALFLMATFVSEELALARLAEYEGTLFSASLTLDNEARLCEAFGAAGDI